MAFDLAGVALPRYRTWALCALAGFASFLIPQGALFAQSSAPLADSPGWFLNSGRNVAAIELTLFVSAAVVAFLQRGRWGEGAAAFAAGATWAMGATLFVIGPGTIFPIVMGIGGALMVAAVAVGTVAGACGALVVGRFRRPEGPIGFRG
jgi:hypothetical protein